MTLFERLLGRAEFFARELRNETKFDLLHRVIDDAYSRICREAFRPDSSWEAYLTDRMRHKRADILDRRIDEHIDLLQDRDPWTIVSRFGSTATTDPQQIAEMFERRKRQYLGLRAALSNLVVLWTSAGGAASEERAWGVLKKLIVEIVLREANNTTRVPLALIARRLKQRDRKVRNASEEAFREFYRIVRNDPKLTDTEFHSVFSIGPQ
jgi:hypothetical protein